MSGQLTLTRRAAAWAAAVVLAFAVPFGVSDLRGGDDDAPAPAAGLDPPAIADIPALPVLRDVAALPAPPPAEQRRPRDTARPGRVATPAPALATAPVAITAPRAPVAAPQSPRKSFDSTG